MKSDRNICICLNLISWEFIGWKLDYAEVLILLVGPNWNPKAALPTEIRQHQVSPWYALWQFVMRCIYQKLLWDLWFKLLIFWQICTYKHLLAHLWGWGMHLWFQNLVYFTHLSLSGLIHWSLNEITTIFADNIFKCVFSGINIVLLFLYITIVYILIEIPQVCFSRFSSQ